MLIATASSASPGLRPRLSRRLHPLSAAGPGLWGHPLPEFRGSPARPASLRWGRGRDRVRDLMMRAKDLTYLYEVENGDQAEFEPLGKRTFRIRLMRQKPAGLWVE